MKKILLHTWGVLVLMECSLACQQKKEKVEAEEKPALESIRAEMVDKKATDETVALFGNLRRLSENHILFGYQAATEYGRGWSGEEDRSDVKEATGSHPAVIGHDFAGFTGSESLEETKREMERLTKLISDTYNRGGVTTIAWHFRNPIEGNSFYWEQSPVRTVERLIPGGDYHEKYKELLGWIGQFANQVRGADRKLVPMIFRPYHEFDGDWFWWGQSHATREDFITLWRFTVAYLRDELNVHNFIYAFSPDCRFHTEEEFLDRYPGDEWVDMVGVDNYADFGRDSTGSLEAGIHKLKIVSDYAKAHHKLAAFTETGLESIPDTTWWTQTLLHAVKNPDMQLAYVLVWRNDSKSETHYYATPPKGHPSHANFMEFYEDPFTLFENDLKDIYQW